jgi:hypothetical protein
VLHPDRGAPVTTFRAFLIIAGSCGAAWAQGNYEIQVYGADTVLPHHTMVEIHSNFTFQGSKTTSDGTLPTNHQLHETLEITHGFNDWFETGFYVFTSVGPGQGYQWVGDHIRPRVRVPEKWKWPVGVSISTEIGYQRAAFSPDTWTWEIRPIVDKQIGPWYLAFNPAMERSWHGPGVPRGAEFAPGAKVGYQVTKKLAAGMEYYGSTGPILGFDPIGEQQQQFVPSIDYDFGENWEFNFGVGVGVTHSTDHLLVKMIVGRRFDWSAARPAKIIKALVRK